MRGDEGGGRASLDDGAEPVQGTDGIEAVRVHDDGHRGGGDYQADLPSWQLLTMPPTARAPDRPEARPYDKHLDPAEPVEDIGVPSRSRYRHVHQLSRRKNRGVDAGHGKPDITRAGPKRRPAG